MPTYLEELTIRLATGVASLPENVRQRHAEYLISMQRPDGGFAGREGGSDLYYSSFALRGLSILGELYGPLAERAAQYLKNRFSGQESIVDFLSLIYSASLLDVSAGIDIFAEVAPTWRQATADTLEKLRRDDGGYAKTEQGAASSTYHTFLVLLCLELLEIPVSQPEKIVSFLMDREDEEGGFHEIRASKRAGANPTAAAIGSLRILGKLTDEARENTIDFLVDMQTDEGGFLANTRIPIADLLSTFTALHTLIDLGALEEIDIAPAWRFVQSMQREEGGFHGAVWDPAHDVEYSFYGIGCLALLYDKVS